ncbi:MAG: aminoacetone oxidase family FAD-binding enzyme [Clostridia bacterium]|nr:aminoacetone oxidase family FAD-binding enzyme [Clostridia bacterium]
MQQVDIAIVGAGASGMIAAAAASGEARRSGKQPRILLFEKEKMPGKKLLATGNGKCNLANRTVDSGFYDGDRSFIDAVFGAFSPADALLFFRSIGVPTADDGSGRLYPVSRRAGAVVAALRAECERCGAQILCETPVMSLRRENGGFIINNTYSARRLIVTAGGDAGLRRGEKCGVFRLLRELGVRSSDRYPCLCGLKLADYPASLKGVRNICTVTLTAAGKTVFSEKGEIQFNADGISGIPVMQGSLSVSRLLRQGENCLATLDLVPDSGEKELAEYFSALAEKYADLPSEQLFGGCLPKPLCVYLIKRVGVSPAEPFPVKKSSALAVLAKNLPFSVAATADFPEAQVSGGGVFTDQFDPRTLEARAVPGLFAAGEILDVTGLCGGYNLAWAWCSGYVAGRAAGKF